MAPPPAPAQFPPPAPAQVPPVEPPRKAGSGKALSGIAMALGAAAIAIALIGMVMFPGPAGAAGTKGDKGDTGDTGAPGTNGANGANGANGLDCWDLNGNGVGDLATEDLNGDLVVDVRDCTGLPGPGSIMTFVTEGNELTINAYPTCTNYMSVTINVPSDGQVVVSSTVWLRISHTTGTDDVVLVVIGDAVDDCQYFDGQWRWQETVDGSIGTETALYLTAGPQRVFPVTAGSNTFYVNGVMFEGRDANDYFWRGNAVAVFYPS